MGYPKKNPHRRMRHNFWKKTSGIFRSVTLPLEIPDKMKVHLWKFQKIVLQSLEFPRPKAKTHGTPYDFFWITPINSTSFCIDPSRNFHSTFYLFSTPRNSMSSTPLFGFFHGIAPYIFLQEIF